MGAVRKGKLQAIWGKEDYKFTTIHHRKQDGLDLLFSAVATEVNLTLVIMLSLDELPPHTIALSECQTFILMQLQLQLQRSNTVPYSFENRTLNQNPCLFFGA